MADNLKQKTIKGVSWSFVEQILTRGVNFVIGIILARLLSPTDYGLVGMLGIFIAISQIFIDGGLASALIRQKNPSDQDFSTVYIVNMTLSVVFYFLLFFTSPLIASFYNQPLLKPILRVLSLTLVIGSAASIHGVLLTIRVDFKTKSLISFLAAILSGAAGIIFALKGFGPWALVAQSVTSAVVVAFLTLVLVRWMPRLVFSKDSFRNLFSYSSKVLATSLIGTIYYNAYPMVIGKRFTPGDVGLFSRAGQFPNVVNDTFNSAFNRVSYPILSRVQDNDQRLVEVFEKYLKVFCFCTFPVLMGLCGCSRPLVSLLLTDKWLDCVPLMQLLCFSLLPNGIILFNLNLLYVKGRSDILLRVEIIKKIIMFSIMFLSMFFGLKAMCCSIILNSCIDFCFCARCTKKILDYPMIRQLKALLPYLLTSLVVLAESFFICRLILDNWLSLILSLVVCSASYVLLSKVFHLYAYQEAKGMIVGIIPKRNKA